MQQSVQLRVTVKALLIAAPLTAALVTGALFPPNTFGRFQPYLWLLPTAAAVVLALGAAAVVALRAQDPIVRSAALGVAVGVGSIILSIGAQVLVFLPWAILTFPVRG